MSHYFSLTLHSWRKEVHNIVIVCSTAIYWVQEISMTIR